MTRKEIKDNIQWLKDDNTVCRNIMLNPESTQMERVECSARIFANNTELVRLQNMLIMLNKKDKEDSYDETKNIRVRKTSK